LVLKLQSIEGIHTESSYKTNFDELFSISVLDARTATLEKAAQEVVRGLGGGMRKPSATIKGCKIADCPVRAKLLVWIDVEICQYKLENWRTKGKSVCKGTFTGEQLYFVERQAIETTERNRDDGDQPMEPNDHRSDGFSNGTDVTHGTNGPGSDLFSQQTKQSSDDDGTSIDVEMIESEKTSVSIFGSLICLKKP